jgi:AmmeMemoRadiSam system protein A
MSLATSAGDRQRLLDIAREAIVRQVTGRSGGPVLEMDPDPFGAGAAFVTVLKHGELRGCIGHIERDEPLTRVVARCAAAACSADPRFPPVAAAELVHIAIELSLLGPLEAIGGPDEIEIGRHGLVVESERRRGLLLPQVATEWRWDAATFLAQTCRKAGLTTDAWRHGAQIFRFAAEVFGEPDAR